VTLADAVETAKLRQQIQNWDAGEQRLAEQLKLDVSAPLLPKDVRERFDIFAKWCAAKFVRKCPAKPHVVASFILDQGDLGASTPVLVAMVEAIEAVHNHHSLSNPCATQIVNAALNRTVEIDPPRSWNAEEKGQWARLPARVREAISRTELARDKGLRRAQQKAADERRQTNGAAKPVQINGKGLENHGQA
jgi:hypothetical protein